MYRTRSWEETIKEQYEDGLVLTLEMQPGNGMRYGLVFTRIAHSTLYMEGPYWVISWPEKNKSMYLQDGCSNLLHWSYVAKKMDCRKGDAVVLAEVIARVVGREASSSEEIANQDENQPVTIE